MKLILTLSILFAISFYASGQSKMNRSNYLKGKLAGKISLPEGTEIPEEGIYVYLLDEDKGVFTDQKGYYQFQDLRKKTLYHIRVMIFGYKSQEFAVVTSKNPTTTFNINYQMKCEFDTERAILDWNSGNAKFFMASGIVSYVNQSDEPFEEKYGIEYYDFGCVAPVDNCIIEYNSKIFELMDLKFGIHWRKEVRKDIEH